MPPTARIKCDCGWIVVVESTTSWNDAQELAFQHIEENKTHAIFGAQTVWTNNPYIPPTE